MNIKEIIAKKRDGLELNKEEIKYIEKNIKSMDDTSDKVGDVNE